MKPLYILLSALCILAFAGARPTLRGFPLGKVADIDKDAQAVSVDLGKVDGVIKGIKFSVVAEGGTQVAVIAAEDVYNDLFWSAKLPPETLARMAPGMQVRWVLTPELTMLMEAKKKDTVSAYREFITSFPDSGFLPDLVRGLPDDIVKELDPDFYEAWKAYTKDAFLEFIKGHPKGGLARLAETEIKSIEAYEKEQGRLRQERAARAAAYEEEQKRRSQLEEKVQGEAQKAERKEYMGKLVNNSASPVRFVFQSPSDLPATAVQPNSSEQVRHPEGSYGYKVYAVEANPAPAPAPPGPGAEPTPIKEGTVEIDFDLWEVDYP